MLESFARPKVIYTMHGKVAGMPGTQARILIYFPFPEDDTSDLCGLQERTVSIRLLLGTEGTKMAVKRSLQYRASSLSTSEIMSLSK